MSLHHAAPLRCVQAASPPPSAAAPAPAKAGASFAVVLRQADQPPARPLASPQARAPDSTDQAPPAANATPARDAPEPAALPRPARHAAAAQAPAARPDGAAASTPVPLIDVQAAPLTSRATPSAADSGPLHAPTLPAQSPAAPAALAKADAIASQSATAPSPPPESITPPATPQPQPQQAPASAGPAAAAIRAKAPTSLPGLSAVTTSKIAPRTAAPAPGLSAPAGPDAKASPTAPALAQGGDDDGAAPANDLTPIEPAATPAPATAKHEATSPPPHQAGGDKTTGQTATAPQAAAPAPSAPADTQAAPPAAGVPAVSAAGQAPTAHTAAAAPSTLHAAPGAPAAQIAQGLSALHLTGAGARQVTIHLTPGLLGAVQVRIERGGDGTAIITLQVEKAETLRTLQQDSAHLHEALDRAGVPAAGRQLSYELAQGQAASGFAAGNGGSQGNPSQGQRGGQTPQPPIHTRAEAEAPERATPPPRRAVTAAGINITA